MTKTAVSFGMVFLASLLVFVASAASNSTINGTMANATVTTNYTAPIVINASSQSIALASNITIDKVGVDYFNQYMSFRDGYTYLYPNGTNLTVVSFTYNIPFINGTETTAVLAGGPVVTRLGVIVLFDNGNLVNYIGPESPYVIKVTASSAFAAAENFGLQNITGSYITAVWNNMSTYNSTAGYDLDWAVFQIANKSAGYPDGQIQGVYVRINKPSVSGEFVYNPAILSTQTGIDLRNNIIGNFTAFTLVNGSYANNVTAISLYPGASLSQQSIVLYGIAALLVLLFIIYAVRRRS